MKITALFSKYRQKVFFIKIALINMYNFIHLNDDINVYFLIAVAR